MGIRLSFGLAGYIERSFRLNMWKYFELRFFKLINTKTTWIKSMFNGMEVSGMKQDINKAMKALLMDTERQSKMNPSEMGAATTIKMDVFITTVSSKSFVERSLRCFISTKKPGGHRRALAPRGTEEMASPPPFFPRIPEASILWRKNRRHIRAYCRIRFKVHRQYNLSDDPYLDCMQVTLHLHLFVTHWQFEIPCWLRLNS